MRRTGRFMARDGAHLQLDLIRHCIPPAVSRRICMQNPLLNDAVAAEPEQGISQSHSGTEASPGCSSELPGSCDFVIAAAASQVLPCEYELKSVSTANSAS